MIDIIFTYIDLLKTNAVQCLTDYKSRHTAHNNKDCLLSRKEFCLSALDVRQSSFPQNILC
jgi:hypothetical protein